MIRSILFASCLFAAAVTSASVEEPMFHNPLVRQRADPFAYLHTDGFYYFMATVPEYDRLELRRARSLDELGRAEAKVVWRKHDAGVMGAHIWAPEIHFIDGKWFIYFAAGEAKRVWEIRIFALENASPNPLEGEWVERGQIRTKWETFALDATTFEHRGARYLLWAQREPGVKNNSDIYLARMDTPTSIVGEPTRITRPELPWETRSLKVNEGPAAIVRNGRVFVAFSANSTGADYCVGLLTADADADLLDPKSWSKSPSAVFETDAAAGVFGPGHNCFTTTPDGKSDVFVYHARAYRDIKGNPLKDPNRDTRAQILNWTPDGRPDFSRPVPDAK